MVTRERTTSSLAPAGPSDRLVGPWLPQKQAWSRANAASAVSVPLRSNAPGLPSSRLMTIVTPSARASTCSGLADHDARVQQLCGVAVPVECCFALVGLGLASVADAVAAFRQLYDLGHDALVAALELINVPMPAQSRWIDLAFQASPVQPAAARLGLRFCWFHE